MTIGTSLTEELILGILAEQPCHGYQIEKLIEERGMRKWTDVGFSSIYYILEKLEKKGLAESVPTKGKDKKEYNITKSGSAVLAEKTRHRLIDRQPANSHFMTALSNSQRLSSKELIEVFTKRNTGERFTGLENTENRRKKRTTLCQTIIQLCSGYASI